MLLLGSENDLFMEKAAIASTLLEFLPNAVYLVPSFFQSRTWSLHKLHLEEKLINLAPSILSQIVLASNEFQGFIHQSFALLLQELTQMSLQRFAELVELISLSVRSSESALDLLLEIMEPQASRLLVDRPQVVSQFLKSLFGIALDHIDEASCNREPEKELLKLEFDGHEDGFAIVKCIIRIDSSMSSTLKVGDHVRLTVSSPPENAPLAKPASMDAIVVSAMVGSATFRCIHNPPSHANQCTWTITQCGSFVTSKAMFDAVLQFYAKREICCGVFSLLVGLSDRDHIKHPNVEISYRADVSLNRSQNAALDAAMKHSLTFIWGPPGTGKTHTVTVILIQLLNDLPGSRFLVTAPTHNAVDNMLRRFITDGGEKKSGAFPIRVSTQVSILVNVISRFTCI
jgi:regulator of nonsense transcripts 1